MWRRIRIYLFGVVLGSIVVWAMILRNRNVDEYLRWTPGERILEEIRTDSNTVLPANFMCLLDCSELTTLDYKNLINKGSVDFKKSSPRETPRKYVVEYKDNDRTTTAVFHFMNDEQHLKKIFVNGPEPVCNCTPDESN